MKENFEKVFAEIESLVGTEVQVSSKKNSESGNKAHPPITLVAVSKKQPAEKIRKAYEIGQRDFGENYLQEAQEKQEQLSDLKEIQWHFIGALQSKKIKDIVGQFSLIQSVGSLKHLKEINKQAQRKSVMQKILIQINFAKEESKSGASVKEFFEMIEAIKTLDGLILDGLMMFPPLYDSEQPLRRDMKDLKELQSLAKQKLSGFQHHRLNTLSVGTTSDYKVCVEEGSNMIRLGTLLFGERS